jgi:signal recognition particle GTPase
LGDAAKVEAMRKGNVGEFLLWMEEQSVLEDTLLNPEVNLTKHLAAIYRCPSQYWQQLTELLIEKDWSVKQTELIVSAIKDIDIPECFQQWLNPEVYIKKTIAEALSGEIRTPKDFLPNLG